MDVNRTSVVADDINMRAQPGPEKGKCHIRGDGQSIWDEIKAWYLIFLHLLASIGLVIGIMRMDGGDFNIGTSPSYFTFDSRLYQTQATGLISLALVLVRIVAGCCSTLLAWRTVEIMLEKRGLTLAEILHFANWRVPILPSADTKAALPWSIWGLSTGVLLWPQVFAAPLASSSVSWIPGFTQVGGSISISVAGVGQHGNWLALLYPALTVGVAVSAGVMTGKDPAYSFNNSEVPLRRYLQPSRPLVSHSSIDLSVPYFTVDLHWIDASSNNLSRHVGSSRWQDVDQDFHIRNPGAIAIIRHKPWRSQGAAPKAPSTFVGQKLVAVKLRTLNFGAVLQDGSRVAKGTKCPAVDPAFGRLPSVEQHRVNMVIGDDIVAYDCYILALANITAGKYNAKNCEVTSSAAGNFATGSIPRNDSMIEEDWLTHLTLDFTSEVLKYTVMQNFTQPSGDLDQYTAGMLTLGYHAAWSSLSNKIGNGTEPASVRLAEPVVVAAVDRARVGVWLVLNTTLTISALLVFIAGRFSERKTVRDVTLAVLMLDFSEVSHRDASGLCNAVTLNNQDRRLPKLKWRDNVAGVRDSKRAGHRTCTRTVVLVTGRQSEDVRGGHAWNDDLELVQSETSDFESQSRTSRLAERVQSNAPFPTSHLRNPYERLPG